MTRKLQMAERLQSNRILLPETYRFLFFSALNLPAIVEWRKTYRL